MRPRAILGRGRLKIGLRRVKSEKGLALLDPILGPFLDQNPLKIMNFRHRFLDAFLDAIFDGFGRRLDVIFEGFGMPNGVQNGKGRNMKNICFTIVKLMFSRF